MRKFTDIDQTPVTNVPNHIFELQGKLKPL